MINMKNEQLKESSMIMLLLTLIFLFISGCTGEAESMLHGEERTAADAIETRGYKILSNLGESEAYVLDREKLMQPPYMNIWSMQEAEPELYFGKTITSYDFVVSGHRLEQMYASVNQSSDYYFHVNIMLSEGEVIGGYSYPVRKDGTLLMGGVYSLDGKSLDEMTGLSYSEWLAEWKKKYSP